MGAAKSRTVAQRADTVRERIEEYQSIAKTVKSDDAALRECKKVEETERSLPRILLIHNNRTILVNWKLGLIGALDRNFRFDPATKRFTITGDPKVEEKTVHEMVFNSAIPTMYDFGETTPVTDGRLFTLYERTVAAIVLEYPPVYKTSTVKYNLAEKLAAAKKATATIEKLKRTGTSQPELAEAEGSYMYIVQHDFHRGRNLPIFKVGRTNNSQRRLMKEYPDGTEIYLVRRCKDCHELEKKVLKVFRGEQFHLRTKDGFTVLHGFLPHTEDGLEYFEGDVETMIKVLNQMIDDE